MAFPQYTVRAYSGSAVATSLTSTGLGATYGSTNGSAFYVNNAQTWLENNASGGSSANALGTSGPFVVAVDYGTANEEKVLCSSVNLSNGQVTVWTDGTNNGRGYDGSSTLVHTGNAVCVPVFTATEAKESNYATSQTVGLIGAAGDILQGNGAQSLAKLSAGAAGTVLTSAGTGNALTWTVVTNPVGTILDFAGAAAPSGYVLCDGSSYSTTGGYAALYAVIGTTYGSGSGTFKVPDLRGRVTAGVGSVGTNAQPSLALAASGGEQNHTLTSLEMPSHTHSLGGESFTSGSTLNIALFNGNATTASLSGTAGPTNATTAHNNMQPYLAVTKIIKF